MTLGRGRREADGGDVYEAPSPPLRPSCCIKEIALLCICTPTFRVSALADGKPLYHNSNMLNNKGFFFLVFFFNTKYKRRIHILKTELRSRYAVLGTLQ